MKYSGAILLSLLVGNAYAYSEQTFTIKNVGGSLNTNTVFLNTEESATDSTCSRKSHFKMADSSPHADRFFSLMLSAQAQGKKVKIGYDESGCYYDAVAPRVYKIVND